jgi:hypothetical protein
LSKFVFAALAVVAALALSFGVRSSTPTAHADVDSTVAIWCGFIDPIANCDDGVSAADIAAYAAVLGDEDDVLEASDFDDIDLDANQITDGTGDQMAEILIFAFVDDDGTVSFDAETGVDVEVSDSGGGFSADTDGNAETCADGDGDDEDCDTAVLDDGDGVVVATIRDGTAGEGADVDVDVEQDGAGTTETVSIVGEADDVALTLVESTIQSDADADCAGDGGDPAVTDDDALSGPATTIAIAVVTDNDGRALTRIGTDITSGDTDIAEIGDVTLVSVDGGDSGIAAFGVICGGDDTGTVDITADIGVDDDTAELTVVGEPATITLAAAPAQIACDGTQTSTVTATVTDADGNNVANGTGVTFSVVALGTANPINTTTTDGTASSTITPLSGATAGVTVIVSAGDATASTRVDCSLPVPTPTGTGPVATPTRSGTIGGPDTGNGGYLGQDSASGFPMWTLVALALGSFALVAGGMVTRRAGK